MTELRRSMVQALELRNYSPRTVETYVSRVSEFARYFGKSPAKLGLEQINTFQAYLRDEKEVSWSYFNQTVCALRFLYKKTLQRDWAIEHIPFARMPKKLPIVLSVSEVKKTLDAVKNLKHRTILSTIYSTGVRVSEAAKLRVDNIDSQRMVIRIESGKGQKDRYVPLSTKLLSLLRGYWKQYRPQLWLFPGRPTDRPITINSIQQVCSLAAMKAGLDKKVSPHMLRHSYATHLLENEVDVCTIQLLLGHRSLSTTSRYTHVSSEKLQSTPNPFDLLDTMKNI